MTPLQYADALEAHMDAGGLTHENNVRDLIRFIKAQAADLAQIASTDPGIKRIAEGKTP